MPPNVRLSDEAYWKLRLLKREGESFSDVIHRLVGSLKDPRKLRELSPPAPGPSWDEIDRRMRARDRRRAKEVFTGTTHPRRG